MNDRWFQWGPAIYHWDGQTLWWHNTGDPDKRETSNMSCPDRLLSYASYQSGPVETQNPWVTVDPWLCVSEGL